uniref:Secreted protein n=1 Tax=Bionectria ochroleuca TaxID=29856 RepID=A0A8H7TS17_BIOOC
MHLYQLFFSVLFSPIIFYFKFMQSTSSCNVFLVTANCVHMDMLHTLSSPTTTSRLYDLAFTSRKKAIVLQVDSVYGLRLSMAAKCWRGKQLQTTIISAQICFDFKLAFIGSIKVVF